MPGFLLMNLRIALNGRAGRSLCLLIACLGCQLFLLSTSEDVWAEGELSQKPGTAGCISQNGSEGFCQDGNGLGGGPYFVTSSPDGDNVYIASRMGVAIFKRDRQTGELQQLDGKAGCISRNGGGGFCQDRRGLRDASSIVTSPDGTSVYVASEVSSAIAIFQRNPQTGELAQPEGKAGCISQTGNEGTCQDGRGLEFPTSVTVSPDGTSVYVASDVSSAIAIFQRNPRTGTLRQLKGKAGCISERGSRGECRDGRGVEDPSEITISPDGYNVYLTSDYPSALAIFKRNPHTGALRQLKGKGGCISMERIEGCRKGKRFDRPWSVTVSPDGTNVYVGSLYDPVAIFKRDLQTGELAQKGVAGCISEGGSESYCLGGAYGVTVSPDGTNVYTADNEGVATLERNPQTGELAQLGGKAGCISRGGRDGACQDNQLLVEANSVTVSPDGTSVYVASERGVLIFDRAPGISPSVRR